MYVYICLSIHTNTLTHLFSLTKQVHDYTENEVMYYFESYEDYLILKKREGFLIVRRNYTHASHLQFSLPINFMFIR